MFIAVLENVDMDFAAFTLIILFLVSLSRVWMLRTLHGRRHLPSKKRIMICRNRLHAYIRPVIATNAAGPYGIR
ncbi:hypothetical protein ACO0LM_27270, partial [Undibacterium sp. Di26W]|uniref:hypothetical protein n=1 Tax=Undibacterium sp. Di26W TaxID=3413035 RepID=UPI003BF33EAE